MDDPAQAQAMADAADTEPRRGKRGVVARTRWLTAAATLGAAALVAGTAVGAPVRDGSGAASGDGAAAAADGTAAAGSGNTASGWLDGEWHPDIDQGPFASVVRTIGAADFRATTYPWRRYTGAGVGVALVDTGVVPVQGLNQPYKVANGADLSFESQSDELRYLDTYGHGTHMAAIIAGTDVSGGSTTGGDANTFIGVAPGAYIVNVKVAASDGATDVSQLIAGIDWAVAHRDEADIRVLNLSYGTDALQPYEVDPLAHAVEAAWRSGIVVVVAAGNDGAAGTTLTNPAIDPYVIAVGASDTAGTSKRSDDTRADFSSVGNDDRRPDLLAPGRSLAGLRAPGSHIDQEFPDAREGTAGQERFFRGSGTSQAAAVTSGAVALLLEARPELTPDQVKHLLMANATPLAGVGPEQGAGELLLRGITTLDPGPASGQAFAVSQGTGSLELARGGSHVTDPTTGQELHGEVDIFGTPWQPDAAWNGRTWNGRTWSGDSWSCTSWSGPSWCGATWTDTTWAGTAWPVDQWEGVTWRDGSWNGVTWRDTGWTGVTWRSDVWTGVTWRASVASDEGTDVSGPAGAYGDGG